MDRISLSGDWSVRLPGEDAWRTLAVPGCWEMLDVPKDIAGPVTYQRVVETPEAWSGRATRIRFEGVSYHCEVFVNGHRVGDHTGSWDGFWFDVTHVVTPGEPVEVEVRVEKPASLTDGPDSDPVPGRFPLRETLSGFLPYVWGHMFGGLWQDVLLECADAYWPSELHASGDQTGTYRIEGTLVRTSSQAGRSSSDEAGTHENEAPSAAVHVFDPGGEEVARHPTEGQAFAFESVIDAPRTWSPADPALYTVELRVDGRVLDTRRFGFRSVGTDGTTLSLGGMPIYPRMILHWGWYHDALHSNPGPERMRREYERLRDLGYNGVKFCLWVPPVYAFDIADEMGMLVWLELPMWLPHTTDALLAQTPVEYERIVRAVRHHPSIVVYSLGCELSTAVGADLLEALYGLVKGLVGDALVRDNSGSGEAYGGLLDEFAEFYDYHFYSDLQFFRPLVDSFSPRWRPTQPWLFGEYADSDTFRDLPAIDEHFGGRPWWATADPARNPKGARWLFTVVEQEERLRDNGMWERSAELAAISHKQALLHRKATLEATRTYREISGYVVTGAIDTPLSTAGMWDDTGSGKFPAESFAQSNLDTVLCLGWDRRRRWHRGGDRTAYWDTYCYRIGERVRAHLIVSHYGTSEGVADVTWRATAADGMRIASGHVRSARRIVPGTVEEVGIADFTVPDLAAPTPITLSATIEVGAEAASNRWTLWFFPREPREELPDVGVYDPAGHLAGIGDVVPVVSRWSDAPLLVCTEWSSDVEARIHDGARAVVMLTGRTDDPIPTEPMPFWREAVKVIEPHPAWRDFPHDGWTDLQFYGLATDLALDTSGLPEASPVLRRVDARSFGVHDYAIELAMGTGAAMFTTLRFAGGLGDQPVDLKRATAGRALLRTWLKHLDASRS